MKIGSVIHEIYVPNKLHDFVHIFLLCTVFKNNVELSKDNHLMDEFFKFGTPVRDFVSYFDFKIRDV